MSKTLKDVDRRIKRQQQVQDGAYDGRYMTKVVESGKRKQERKRKKINPNKLDAYLGFYFS